MAKNISWNKRATEKLDEITSYLQEEFSFQSAQNFIQKVFDKLDLLSRYPEIGQKSQKKKNSEIYAN